MDIPNNRNSLALILALVKNPNILPIYPPCGGSIINGVFVGANDYSPLRILSFRMQGMKRVLEMRFGGLAFSGGGLTHLELAHQFFKVH